MSDIEKPSGQRSPEAISKSRAVIARRRRNVRFIVATVMCLIFATLGGVVWWTKGRDAALMAQGHVWTTAQVAEKESWRYVRNGALRYEYFLHLSFADAAGGLHVVRKSVGALAFRDAIEGQRLRLRYAEADPTIVELQEGDLQGLSHWSYWVMVVGAAGAVLLVFFGFVLGRKGHVV